MHYAIWRCDKSAYSVRYGDIYLTNIVLSVVTTFKLRIYTHFPVEVRYVYFFSMWCTCRALSISLSISWKAIIHTGGSLVHLVGWVHNFIRYTAQCHISRTWVLHGLLLGTTLHNHTSFSIGTTLQQTFLTWRKTYDCSWIYLCKMVYYVVPPFGALYGPLFGPLFGTTLHGPRTWCH